MLLSRFISSFVVSEFVFGNSLVGGPGTRTSNPYFGRFSERGCVPRDAPEVVRANNAVDPAIAHEGECHLLTKVVFMQPFRCGVNNVDDRMLALPIANSVNLVV